MFPHSTTLSKGTYLVSLWLMVANLLITRQQCPLDSMCVAEDGQTVLIESSSHSVMGFLRAWFLCT